VAGDNRTEKATPRRRNEARRKGQVAKSVDVASAAVLLATFTTLAAAGPAMLGRSMEVVRRGLAQAGDPDLVRTGSLAGAVAWQVEALAWIVAPVAVAALAAGLLVNVAMVKLKLSPLAVKPSLKKIDPVSGLKRLFGPHSWFEAAKTFLKAGVVALVAFLAVWPELPTLGALVGLPAGAMVVELGRSVLGIAFRAGAAFALIAAADIAFQRWRHEKSLRMTKDEVKREARDQDIPPELRGAIRRKQFEQARRRMLAEVPTSDVVVTNPTHFAVALRYDGTKPAPELVAKGADLVAKAIREIAEEHGVPILSNPPLARSLYQEVELGHLIPERFFHAVAEVLAFVYRTAGRAAWKRRAEARRAESRALNPPAGGSITDGSPR
jgi:flagellar biosynthetic protein FlhB